MTWNKSPAETLALPINALALLILDDYKASQGWNWQNWMRQAEQEGTARDSQVNGALGEGWQWLMTHGLVARDSSQSSTDAYRITRLGEDTLKYGVAKLTAAERLAIALHHRIAQRVESQFLLGEYDLAVFAAMREVEIRVRELAGASDGVLGTRLMQWAFAPNGTGPLTDGEAETSEQEAAMYLFRGAIGLFKNPASHRAVSYEDPVLASEVILLADLLLRMLDRIEQRP